MLKPEIVGDGVSHAQDSVSPIPAGLRDSLLAEQGRVTQDIYENAVMRNTIILLLVFCAGLASGVLLLENRPTLAPMADRLESETHSAKHLIPGYICPMHPSVVSNEPGSCPICGMALERRQLESSPDESGISVSPVMSNSLGVRIAHAEIDRVSEQVFASGNVERVTPATSTEVVSSIHGTVKEVFARTGEWVGEGEFIMAIEAPHFREVQDAYLEAKGIKDYETMAELRKQLARMGARQAVLDGVDRVNNIELTPEFIVEAPHSGILEWTADAGTAIEPGQAMTRVTTKTIARVRLRSYARSARSVVRGRRAQLDIPHMPGLYWPGRVVEVNHDGAGFYSLIEADFEVPADATEKGLFVGAWVNAGTDEAVLRVPAGAVIRAEGESRVVRLRSDGSFEPVVVETGYIGSEWSEIRSGLTEGDAVVARAQFLIDSEATLRAGMARMAGE